MAAITYQSFDNARRAPPEEPRYAFEIDATPIWPAEDGRLEPVLLADPGAVETGDFAPLDPERSGAEPDARSAPPRQRASLLSLLGSLGVHLPTLLVLMSLTSAPAEVSGAIPMQLVIEQSPAAPDEPQADHPGSARPSEARQAEKTDIAPPPAPKTEAAEVAPPPKTKAVEVAPPPKTTAVEVAPPAKPSATPKIEIAEIIPPPKPSPPPEHTPVALPAVARVAPAATSPEPVLAPAPLATRIPGADAPPGDYLDYLVTLTRGHFDLLPLSFLAGRHGRTTLSVLVFEDGTISRIAIKQGSGYPDIDAKIEQMVAAVGRFPPVPTSFRKPRVELDFNMTFPDALQQ